MSIITSKFALKAAFPPTTFLITSAPFPTPFIHFIACSAPFHTYLSHFPTPPAHLLVRQAHFPSLGGLNFLIKTSKEKIAMGNGEMQKQAKTKETKEPTKVPLSASQGLTMLQSVSLAQQIYIPVANV